MTSDRSYRPRLSEAAACAELQDNAGTQFDPNIVEVFITIWSHGQRDAAKPIAVKRKAVPGSEE